MTKTIANNDEVVTWKEKLSKVYNIVVIDQENLHQKGSYTFSLGQYLSMFLMILFLTSILTAILLSFTPIKRLIPGYGDIEENKKYLELKRDIVELEAGVEVQQTYIDGLQKLFAGELDRSSLPETITDPKVEDASAQQIVTKEDRAQAITTRGLNSAYFTSPLKGSISAAFDAKTKHYGVDVLAVQGAPIKAIAPGIVINADWSLDAGNSISLQHANNTISVYKHNSSLLKKTGDYVRSGEAIAIIGNTGTLSDGPHLHIELWYDGSPVDPENYITF